MDFCVGGIECCVFGKNWNLLCFPTQKTGPPSQISSRMSQEQLEVIGNNPGDDIPGENIADGNNDENPPGDPPLFNDARELAQQIEEKKLKEAQEDCDVAMALVDVQLMKVSGLRDRGEITDCMEAIDRKCTAVE